MSSLQVHLEQVENAFRFENSNKLYMFTYMYVKLIFPKYLERFLQPLRVKGAFDRQYIKNLSKYSALSFPA